MAKRQYGGKSLGVSVRRPYGTGSLVEREGKGGVVTYYATVRVNGRRHKIRLGRKRSPGTREGLTRAQAEREVRRHLDELNDTPAEGMELQLALHFYLEHLAEVRGLKPTTLQDYRIICNSHLLRHFRDTIRIESISPENVEAFLRAQRRRGLSPNTVRNHFNVLSGLSSFALKQGWIATDPTKQVERPRLQRARRRISFLSPQQFMAVLEAMPDDPLGQVQRLVLMVMGLSGLRLGEALALTVEDLDLEARRIRVMDSFTRGETYSPKGDRSRSVPMSSALAKELEPYIEALWVSPNSADMTLAFRHPETHGHVDPSKLRKRFKAALQSAGLPPIRLHDLRHTFGTQCAAAGVPLRLLQEWMGHADPTTTAIYMHYAPDAVRGQELIDRAFDGFDVR